MNVQQDGAVRPEGRPVPAGVNNALAWLLALFPIASACVRIVVVKLFGLAPTDMVVPLVVNLCWLTVVLVIDRKWTCAESSIDCSASPIWPIGLAILVSVIGIPLYLYRRAQLLRQSNTIFIVSVVCCVGWVLVTFTGGLQGDAAHTSDINFAPRVEACASYPRSETGAGLFNSYDAIVHEFPNVDQAFRDRQTTVGGIYRRTAVFVSGDAVVSMIVQGKSLQHPAGFALVYEWKRGTPKADIAAVSDIANAVLANALTNDMDASIGIPMEMALRLSPQLDVLALGGQPEPACDVFDDGLIVEFAGSRHGDTIRVPIVLTATSNPPKKKS